MNRYASNQRFVGLTAINLDNVYSDPSMMRDPLTMKTFARLGVPAPRQAHARLFVNDAYAGVYVIVEPVDRTFVSRVYGETEANVESRCPIRIPVGRRPDFVLWMSPLPMRGCGAQTRGAAADRFTHA
jgi:hypothetical protein